MAETEKKEEKPKTSKGVGAQKGSDRREYRKFRPRPKKDVSKNSNEIIPADKLPMEIVEAKRRNKRLCRFFNSPGGCRLGNDCQYKHKLKKAIVIPEDKIKEVEAIKNGEINENVVVPQKVRFNPKPVLPQKQVIKKDSLGTDAQKALLEAEITYFKRRFRKAVVDGSSGKDTSIIFSYEVTDPDWVFDIRSIGIALVLHDTHPLALPAIDIPEQTNLGMPDVLRRHITNHVMNYCNESFKKFVADDAYETIGKSLIRFLDRNILKMFIDGLTKLKRLREAEIAGISLVLPSKSKDKPDDSIEEHTEKSETFHEENNEEEDEIKEENYKDNINELAKEIENVFVTSSSEKLPIEVFLVWDDMSQNIASITPVLLQIASKCGRCKTDDVHNVPCNNKPVAWRCTKCSTAQSLRLRPSILHQHSPVLAQLDARGCIQLDCVLLNSSMKFICLACNKEDAVQNINLGQAHKSWCRECHTTCEFIVSAVRFRGDFSLGLLEDKVAAGKVPKAKKTVETKSAITLGQPLPEMGTCKHYKKSFRWFRFPCCGRVFPCDNCHEEAGLGHEMKIANRMICGHCSSEQSFSKDKPCISCNSAITRKKSQFWEGGKGCRNQQSMSRNDGHKFSGSRKKTVSKPKTEKLVSKSKK